MLRVRKVSLFLNKQDILIPYLFMIFVEKTQGINSLEHFHIVVEMHILF